MLGILAILLALGGHWTAAWWVFGAFAVLRVVTFTVDATV